MNTPALVSRLDHKALPQWNAGAPGYISMNAPAHDDGSRQASRFGTAFRRYWWVAALIWAAIGIPATVYIYNTIRPQYVASGVVTVKPHQINLYTGQEKSAPFYAELLRTHADRMKRRDILEYAVSGDGSESGSIRGIGRSLRDLAKNAPANSELKDFSWFTSLPDPPSYLERSLLVDVVPATENIRISMAHENGSVAEQIVKNVMQAYMAKEKERQEQEVKPARKELLDRTRHLYMLWQGRIPEEDRDLLSIDLSPTSTTQSSAQAEATSSLEEQLKALLASSSPEEQKKAHAEAVASFRNYEFELERRKSVLEAQRVSLEKQDREKPDEALFKASVPTDGDPQIQAWKKELVENIQQDNQLATKFHATEQHPDRVALRRQQRLLQQQIDAREKEIRNNAWTRFDADGARDRQAKLAAITPELEEIDKQLLATRTRLERSKNEYAETGKNAATVASLREQIADIKEEIKRNRTRLYDIRKPSDEAIGLEANGPGVSNTPTIDRRPKLALAANGMGFILGMGVLVILMKLRDKIDHAEDLPSTFQPLVVGTVSHAGAAARGLEGRMSKKILGEEMRLLHANLLPPGPMQRRIMMITSPTPSNGKTSIASQLALSLAKSGLEVLLIDADLRKRDLSTMFDVGFRPGLSDLLQGRTPELIRPVELLPNLRLMGAGTKLDRNPVELFQRRHFHESLNMLQEKFDCIVVDTPPTLVVADARLIARSADEVLCVVRAQVSSPKDVNQTLDALQRITGKTPKIILNGVAHKQSYYKYKFAYTSGENETATAGSSADSLD